VFFMSLEFKLEVWEPVDLKEAAKETPAAGE
jgi:hypothetical protein